jgi:hypothetical protein
MNKYRIVALFLIIVPIAFNAAFFALSASFEYPDILREPTGYILTQFASGGRELVTLWYSFAVTALLAIPLALLVQQVFAEEYPQLARASGIVGALSGLVQGLGLLRWVFLVPTLASIYTVADSSPALRDAAAIAFQSAHQYLGVAVGEHLGYLFTGSWTILLAVMMFRSRLFNPILSVVGILSAVGIMIGLLEPAGVADAGAVNAISYIIWSLWLIAAGVVLLLRSSSTRVQVAEQAIGA